MLVFYILDTCKVILKYNIRYYDYEHFYFLQQLLLIGMLKDSKQMSSFFPYLAIHLLNKNDIHIGDLLGMSYIFPGPHIKPFFLLLG